MVSITKMGKTIYYLDVTLVISFPPSGHSSYYKIFMLLWNLYFQDFRYLLYNSPPRSHLCSVMAKGFPEHSFLSGSHCHVLVLLLFLRETLSVTVALLHWRLKGCSSRIQRVSFLVLLKQSAINSVASKNREVLFSRIFGGEPSEIKLSAGPRSFQSL